MIIYKNNTDFKELLNKEKQLVDQVLEFQTNQKNLLMSFIIKFVDYLDDGKLDSTEEIEEFAEKLKSSIELSNDNLNAVNSILQAFNRVNNIKLKHNDASYKKVVGSYNEIYSSQMSLINDNNNKILDIIYLISQNSTYDMLSESQTFLNNINKRYKTESIPHTEEAVPSPTVIDKNFYAYSGTDIELNEIPKEEEIQTDGTAENTLLISESMQKVILPFSSSELEDYLKQYPSHFRNTQDVIDKVFTIPLKVFNNPAIARFRETFRLMREKENASIKDALDLALELMFNYNLYPAIITACKNLDELDIYLAYLDTGEIDKFKIFNIVYQLSPTISKKKSSS